MDLTRSLDSAVASGVPGVVAAVTVGGKTVFEGASGVKAAGGTDPMTIDTVVAIYSMTKAVTGAAAMQLVDQGKLSLDHPAGSVLADLGNVPVLEGFAADGTPRLRPARTAITLRHLLTHTSGFVYDMWNGDFANYLSVSGTPPLATLQKAALRVPSMFEPGSAWQYGIGIDWVGLLVEEASGRKLGDYLSDNIFRPLAMVDTGFAPTPAMASRQASLHISTPDGAVPLAVPAPEAPEFEMGGGGLVSTVHDYLRFANMILNGGELGGVRVLQEATVDEMGRNNIGDIAVQPLRTVNPMLTCDADFFPGMECKWGLTFLINTERTPQGRPANSLAWAGLANSYYWIDRANKVCGVWASQLFPFMTPPAIEGFRAFETAFYEGFTR